MSWEEGKQQERIKYSSNINQKILAKKGFIEERLGFVEDMITKLDFEEEVNE